MGTLHRNNDPTCKDRAIPFLQGMEESEAKSPDKPFEIQLAMEEGLMWQFTPM